jgi:tRNA threonylcarbamoyladenosine biosynthesis protein TsaB
MSGLDTRSSGLWLALDTSTATMTAAVLRDGALLGESSSKAERNHSILLVPAIRELLRSSELTMRDLAGIAVGRGPGSYTGVRIAVTVAKTFAWALHIPLVGVSSLSALAYGSHGSYGQLDKVVTDAAGDERWIVPLLDARRGQVYTAVYSMVGGEWTRLAPDGIRLMHNWVGELSGMLETKDGGAAPKRLEFVGEVDGFIPLIEALRGKTGITVSVEASATEMKAFDLGALALRSRMSGETDDVHDFVPNYTQLAEAEKILQQHIKGRP